MNWAAFFITLAGMIGVFLLVALPFITNKLWGRPELGGITSIVFVLLFSATAIGFTAS